MISTSPTPATIASTSSPPLVPSSAPSATTSLALVLATPPSTLNTNSRSSPLVAPSEFSMKKAAAIFTSPKTGKATLRPFSSTLPQEVQSALEALPEIGAGNVSVAGGPGDAAGSNPYRIVFTGAFAGDGLEAGLKAEGGDLQGASPEASIKES